MSLSLCHLFLRIPAGVTGSLPVKSKTSKRAISDVNYPTFCHPSQICENSTLIGPVVFLVVLTGTGGVGNCRLFTEIRHEISIVRAFSSGLSQQKNG